MMSMYLCLSGEKATITIKPYGGHRSKEQLHIKMRLKDIERITFDILDEKHTTIKFYLDNRCFITYIAGLREVEALKAFLKKNDFN